MRLLVLLVVAAGSWWPKPARAAAYDVLDIQAALVGKVAEFITWPPEAGLDDPERPVELVILGRSPLAPRLRELYERRGVLIAGRRVWVRQVDDPRDIGRPHILLIAPSIDATLERLLAALGTRPVLTVAHARGFAQRGVAVNLFEAANRVRFELSRRALRRHGLQASFRLLGMARVVDEPEPR